MIKKKFTILFTTAMIFAAVILSGCGGATETIVVKNDNANQTTTVSNMNGINTTVDSPNNSEQVVNNTAAPPTDNAAAPQTDKNSAPPVKAATPVIGSGANDLTIITKARSVLSGESQLINAVIVNSKEGNVTLTGKVATAADKAKAEQLVRGIEGVKNLKNDITVE